MADGLTSSAVATPPMARAVRKVMRRLCAAQSSADAHRLEFLARAHSGPRLSDVVEFGLDLRDARELRSAGFFELQQPLFAFVKDAVDFDDVRLHGVARTLRRGAA